MNRTKVVLGSMAGAIAIHLTFIACGTMSTSSDSGAADAAHDVMTDVLGAETADALAQSMPMSAPCDQIATYSMTSTNGSAYTVNTYYAIFNVAGLDARTAPHVTAFVCDPVTSPGYPYGACPNGSTCTTSGVSAGPATCQQTPAAIETGTVRVWCGTTSTTQQNADAGVQTGASIQYQNVYLRVN